MVKERRIQTRLKPAVRKKKPQKPGANKRLWKPKKPPSVRKRRKPIRREKQKKRRESPKRSKKEKPAKLSNLRATRRSKRSKRQKNYVTRRKLVASNYCVTSKMKTRMMLRKRYLLSRRTASSTLRVVTTVRWSKRPKN